MFFSQLIHAERCAGLLIELTRSLSSWKISMNKLLHARIPKWPRRLISLQNAIFTQFQTLNDANLMMFCNPTNLPDRQSAVTQMLLYFFK